MALRLVSHPDDAADLTQEALVKVITRIGQFEGRSAFRTWLYRIVFNSFVDSKRGRFEKLNFTFTGMSAELDSLVDGPLVTPDLPEAERQLLIDEANHGCLFGMLLCLDRAQRFAFILGDILECSSTESADILELSPAAFRKRLERARADLSAFMREKCGLMNPDNPCRCEKKPAPS